MNTMITHLLFSVSFLSFLFSYTSFCSSWNLGFLYSKYLCFLSTSMDKNCWFLVFNGLMVILAKTSGFAPSPSGPVDYSSGVADGATETVLEMPESEALCKEDENDAGVREAVEVNGGLGYNNGFEVKKEIALIDCGMHEKQNDDHNDNYDGDRDDDDNDDNDDNSDDDTETLSVEELNKKFEEFIRRMKEEIRVDEMQYQQQQQQQRRQQQQQQHHLVMTVM